MTANYVLGLIGSVITLTLLFELLRRQRLREKYAVFWAVVALVTIVIAIFPQTLYFAADLVGISVPANLLFFGASMLLPGGFFAGGAIYYAGDPGPGILLVPVGAFLLITAVFLVARATKQMDRGDESSGSPRKN